MSSIMSTVTATPHEADKSGLLTEKITFHFLEHYFTRKYLLDIGGILHNDVCILVHSNRVCVITLAPSHFLLRDKYVFHEVDFQVSEKVNRLDGSVRGKKKAGAQNLRSPDDTLCVVRAAPPNQLDENSLMASFRLCCAVKGKLLQSNERLAKQPSLLNSHPFTEGYLAIVLPRMEDFGSVMAGLLDQSAFDSLRGVPEFVTCP